MNPQTAPDLYRKRTYEMRDVVTRTYDAAGNVIAVLDAEGHTTRFEVDAMNRKTAVIDATGYRTETKYTLRGDVVSITNANDETVKFEIDALGRKTAAIDAKGYRGEFQYDGNGNLTCTLDANAQAGLRPRNTLGCTESRSYDELNRLTKITDAQNGETAFTYDLAGNRLTVTDAENKTWRFAYDDLGRLTSETDHSAKTIAYKPDEAGNVYEKTNRLSEITRYSFDNGNRLTRVDYLKDNTWETYGYDPAGNRNAAANSVVSYTFTWDRLNRLTGKTDSRGRSMSFTFDKVGNLLTKTTYQGSTTSYVYNAANRLVMLRNPDYTQVDYQYDPAGRLLSRVTANGARLTQQFDANGWLTRLAQYDAANALISDTTYTRDRAGNILTQADAGGTTTYTMDALYRLSTADYPGAANDELFTYDKVGNIKTTTKGSLTANANTRHYNYTAGTNRLAEIRIGSTSGTLESSFTNDFEGRLTGQTGVGAKTLTWDAKGRVKTLGAETYSYDPMDYRIGRSGGSQGNRSYFLEGEHLESEYSGSNLQAKYFRGVSTDELVAAWMYDTDAKLKPYLFHHDNITSTTAVSGHNGGTTQSVKYAAFGTVQSSTGSSPNRLKYTGREDDGTGLYYYRARYYDPGRGQFISEDPMGFAAGDVNFYAYVGNNPINYNDPSGKILPAIAACAANPVCANTARAGISGLANVAMGATTAWVTGQEYSLGRAGADFAVGAGLSGVATGIAARQAANITAAAKVEQTGAIIGTAQATGTAGHAERVMYEAMRRSEQSGGTTFMNRAMSTATGIKTVPNVRPDVTNFARNGTVNMVEVRSASQTSDQLYGLMDNAMAQLPAGMRGTTHVVESGLPSLYNPVIPIGGILGYQGATAAANGYAAGGGFLLYPNKANFNMMQSVYSK